MATDFIHLTGSEDVRRAGTDMRQAAQEMSQAVRWLTEALSTHQQFLDDWLERYTAAVASVEGKV